MNLKKLIFLFLAGGGLLGVMLHVLTADAEKMYLHVGGIMIVAAIYAFVTDNYRHRRRIWTRSGWVTYEADRLLYILAHAVWIILGLAVIIACFLIL